MRRPLFTTGIPQALPEVASIVATPNSALSILDLRSLSTELQSYTRFLTLYAANQQIASGDIVAVAWREGTSTPVLIGEQLLTAGLIVGGPVKLLDRFPVRGNVEVIASTAVGDAAVVWGYFELDVAGSSNDNIRPLQPGPLVSPFTYEPVIAGLVSEPVHLFDADYFDIVTLDTSSAASGTVNVFDGSDSIDIEVGATGFVRLFDGIPMMSSTPATGTPSISTSLSAEGEGFFLATWGYFTRVS